MSEFSPAHRPALASTPIPAPSDVTITALPEGHVVQVIGKPNDVDLQDGLTTLAGPDPHAVRAAGPGQWFLVGDAPLSRDAFLALVAALRPLGAAIDQSHGRVRIRVEGAAVERMLAKGTAVDLDARAFPVGRSATTLIGHVSVHLTRVGTNAFEIMVLRGFAESLWQDLTVMSAEFGGSQPQPRGTAS